MSWLEAHRAVVEEVNRRLNGIVEDIKKKEARTMDVKTIAALHKSIAHWNDICYGMENNYFSDECALCGTFEECTGCPVKQAGVCCHNGASPWDKYYQAHGREYKALCTVDSAEAAEAMLEMLVSLLPDGESYRKYDVGVDKSYYDPTNEWCLGDGALDISGPTGITTDGRNAFPQSKYVWEKVFITQTDTYQKFFGLKCDNIRDWNPTIHKSAAELMVKDGRCLTCNQPVKRKVTKYKVVYEGREGCVREPGLHISDKYSESLTDFGRKNPSYTGIELVKSTAKEFDCE